MIFSPLGLGNPFFFMGGSKNRGTPKWMVYNGKANKMDDLGIPLFLETPLLVAIMVKRVDGDAKNGGCFFSV